MRNEYRNAHVCMLAELGPCEGTVERGICEEHARLVFQIAWK